MINKFIGIPFIEHGRSYLGCDCVGLAMLFYKDYLKINVDEFLDYASLNDVSNSEKITTYFKVKNFIHIPMDQKRMGDVAIFKILSRPIHMGIVLPDNKYLHTHPGKDSHIISSFNKYHNKVESIWRMNGK